MSEGYVYALSNEFMPGLLKIGKTTRDPAGRAEELYQTGVPARFKVEYSVLTPDCHSLESAIHERFSEYRISDGREFFRVDLQAAISEISNLHREAVEGLVDQYLPGETMVEEPFFIDPADIGILAHNAGEHPYDVVAAFRFLAPNDIGPAMERYRQWQKLKQTANTCGGNVIGMQDAP